MVDDKYSLFRGLGEILYVRIKDESKANLDPEIHNLFYAIFSLYLEPYKGWRVFFESESRKFIWKAEINRNGRYVKAEDEQYEKENIHYDENLNISKEDIWKSKWKTIRPTSSGVYCTVDEQIVNNGFGEKGGDIEQLWWSFNSQSRLKRDNITGNLELKGKTELERILNSYISLGLPLHQLTYDEYVNQEHRRASSTLQGVNMTLPMPFGNAKKLFAELVRAKYIRGNDEDFIDFLTSDTPKNKLEWIARAPKGNGIANGALVNLLELLGCDFTDRIRIIEWVEQYFGLRLSSGVFNQSHSTHYSQLKAIVEKYK